jgi:hypothetical protein
MKNIGFAVVPILQNIIVINIVNLFTDSVHTANFDVHLLQKIIMQ